MLNINKKIKYIISEISLLVLMILLSFFIWDDFEKEDKRHIAYAYSYKNENLKITKSEIIEKDNKIFIKVENNNDKNKKYNLYLTTNEKFNNYIKNSIVTINKKELSLQDIENYKNNNKVYYKILVDNIISRNINSYFISLNSQVHYDILLEEIKE